MVVVLRKVVGEGEGKAEEVRERRRRPSSFFFACGRDRGVASGLCAFLSSATVDDDGRFFLLLFRYLPISTNFNQPNTTLKTYLYLVTF
jgi:hypothetical protein